MVATALGVVVLIAYWVSASIPLTSDAENYWNLDLADPYRNRWAAAESFVYSPAFGQLLYPFTLLPFEVFYRLLLAVNLLCLAYLIGPLFGAVALLLPFVQSELTTGQIHLPLGVMCVAMLRHPSWWAFGSLTKVTPGLTILWFAGRREWRKVATAIAATLVIVVVSFATWPSAWTDWFALLAESSTRTVSNFTVSDWPVVFRLPIGAGLMVMAAWRNRAAAIPLIVCFSLPAIWVGSLVLVLAVPRMITMRGWRRWLR